MRWDSTLDEGGWVFESGELDAWVAYLDTIPSGRLTTPKGSGIDAAYAELKRQGRVKAAKRWPNGDTMWEKA